MTLRCDLTPESALFYMPGFHLWDPSILELDGTFHLFASRWTSDDSADRDFIGWKHSHVIHATSETLLGPYCFESVVLEPRPDHWDRRGIHNPKIIRAGERFLLYYLGMPDFKTGFAFADDINGPWERRHSWSIPANNPALWLHEDGSVYAVGKRRSPKAPKTRPFTNWMEAYRGPGIEGPFERLEPDTNRLPDGYELEDPTIWWAGEAYHVIATDWKGLATGHHNAGVHYRSTDGVTYQLMSQDPLFHLELELPDRTLTLCRRERPQIILDTNSQPLSLCTGIRQAGQESGIAITPLSGF